MSATDQLEEHTTPFRARTPPVVGWTLLAGGAIFFVGGAMHPEEDPPGVTLKEHLRLMYKDNNWYPGHTLILIGVVLIAAALVTLARSGVLKRVPSVHVSAVIAAIASSFGAFAAFLHLIMATEADKIAAHQSTPLTNLNLVVETIATPAFGFSIAVFATLGALTGTVGNRAAAVLAIVGGFGYALAGATFVWTDALDPLFPLAGLLGLWAIVTAISMLRHSRANPSLAVAAR
jgi:hypothetical protein